MKILTRVKLDPAFSAIFVAALCGLANCSCLPPISGKYPKPLASERDIRSASPDTDDITIRRLPPEHYPLLRKFTRVRSIRLANIRGGEGGSDEKLLALSVLNFTNLHHIGLLNCKLVTDRGIAALSKIPSLRTLQLEGTAITDVALELMASRMKSKRRKRR
jgi:hypothetical protein